MKTAGIITHYDVHNHGALLQLTALIRVLAKKGINAKALRFEKNYDFLGHKLKTKYDISIKSLGFYLKYLKNKGLGCTIYNFRKRNTLNRYKIAQNIIGDYYSESPDLDAIIIGSDEVFALHTGPTPIFFGHCLPSENVISYAGSFGPTTINDIERLHSKALVKSGLDSMRAISVRDLNSAEIVTQITGNRPPIVVDPVLLYGFKDEIKRLPKPKEKEYLLIYAYDNRMNTKEEISAIKKYAESKNLKLLSPGFYHEWCDINVDVDPISLLSYFKNAKEIITDTFHGCVMSIITGAKFAVKTRESNLFKLRNLLSEYGLEDRIFNDWTQLEEKLSGIIDYTMIDIEVEKRRNLSMKTLDGMLELCSL